MDGVTEDPDSDDDTPEVGSQQRDVEESRTAHAQHDRNQGVEQVQAQSVTNDPADNLTVPGSVIEGVSVKDGSLDSVDAHTKQTQERQDVVQMSPGNKPLLEDIGSTVEGGTEQSEQITLDHVKTFTAVGTGDMVAANQNTHTTTAYQDTDDLEHSVADLEEEEGNDHNADNGPEVDELRRQDVCVSVSQNRKVVSLDIQKRHDEVLPSILHSDAPPALDAVLVEEPGRVHNEHEDVVEDGLEGRDVGAGVGEEAGEGVGGRDAQGEDLAESEDDPEVDSGQVAVPVDGSDLEGVDALADGGIFVRGGGGSWDGVGGRAFGVANGDGLICGHDGRFIRGIERMKI